MQLSLFLWVYPLLLRKRSRLFKVGWPYLKLRSVWYAGNQVICPCCEGRFSKFLVFGANRRSGAACPGCFSLERHRLLWLYLKNRTNLTSAPLRLLHLAPEYILQNALVNLPNIEYLSGDLAPGEAMVQMDITQIAYPDHSFDAILCSHVLEHIPDDSKAMRELCRVLRPGGWAILHVPLDPKLERTVEAPPDLSPEEREKSFGHHDHRRVYGRDYKEKLEQAGFAVKVDSYSRELGEQESKQFGLVLDEDVYFCTKPA
jgi:SAM-dependent methyltransferase